MKYLPSTWLFRLFGRAGLLLAFVLVPSTLPAAPSSYRDVRYDFALIGDTPYNDEQETNLFPNLLDELNRARLAFVVHDGDIKSGSTPCVDELFERRYRQFQTFRHPLIYLFGDNEWSDCDKVKTNAFEPGERLQRLRDIFCQGSHSLGRPPLPLTRQSDEPSFALWRENVRWIHGRVIYAGLNVPGNDNHFGTPEFAPRNAANLAWIKETFALAHRFDLRAVMIIMQANPHFEIGATNQARRGFNEMLQVFEEETIALAKPVVLVHGDSHYFRMDQPLAGSRSKRHIENFLRVETFGNPEVHWLRVSVDERDPNIFTFRPQWVRRNLVNHGAH